MRTSFLPFHARHLFLFACFASLATPLHAYADDGDGDPSFGSNGRAVHVWPANTIQAEATAVAAGADGGVVTAGWISYPSGQQMFSISLARFRADGAPDPAFGNGGATVLDFDAAPHVQEYPRAVFELPDRKLLVFASVRVSDSGNAERPALMRVLPNGQPDTAFGIGGVRWIDTSMWGSGLEVQMKAAALQPDGKLVAVGYCDCGNGNSYDLLAMRVRPDGALDSGFGMGGWVHVGGINLEFPNAIAIDDAGRIVIAGGLLDLSLPGAPSQPLVVRLGGDGVPDASFGDDGIAVVALPGDWSAQAVATGSVPVGPFTQNRVFVAINHPATKEGGVLALAANGSVATSFGDNGYVDLSREEGTHIDALAMRDDSRLVAAGTIDPNGTAISQFFAARMAFDGTLDTSFDGNGVARYPFTTPAPTYCRVRAMTLSAQRPVVVGTLEDIATPSWSTGVLRLQSDHLFADGFEPN
ncbi:MAG: hypothetical protein ABIS07_06500 [Dokdonella sp.]